MDQHSTKSPEWVRAYRSAAPADALQRDLVSLLEQDINSSEHKKVSVRAAAMKRLVSTVELPTGMQLLLRLKNKKDALYQLGKLELHPATLRSLTSLLEARVRGMDRGQLERGIDDRGLPPPPMPPRVTQAIPRPSTPPVDPRTLPPVLQAWPKGAWEDADEIIRSGNRKEINQLAVRVLGGLTTFQHASDGGLMLGAVTRRTDGQIGVVKPPWWDGRAAGIAPSQGRNAMRNGLIYRATLMMRDYYETVTWYEKHFEASDGSFVTLYKEIRKTHPSQASINEYRLNLSYLRFMVYETSDLALKVAKL